jgi:hypothetical protein
MRQPRIGLVPEELRSEAEGRIDSQRVAQRARNYVEAMMVQVARNEARSRLAERDCSCAAFCATPRLLSLRFLRSLRIRLDAGKPNT